MSDLDLPGRVVIEQTFKMVEQLSNAAFLNPLTSLFNRSALDLFEKEYDRRLGERFAVAFVDLTGFKQINDTYGHDAGDAIIQEAGKRLNALVLESRGRAYHPSGDEFVLVLLPSAVAGFSEQAKQRLGSFTVEFAGKRITARANIGIAMPTEEAVLAKLRERAEEACRLAKAKELQEPLVWSGEETKQKLLDKRWRCPKCNATVSVLLPLREHQEPVSLRCACCGLPLEV